MEILGIGMCVGMGGISSSALQFSVLVVFSLCCSPYSAAGAIPDEVVLK
jgi:hypothetical protein